MKLAMILVACLGGAEDGGVCVQSHGITEEYATAVDCMKAALVRNASRYAASSVIPTYSAGYCVKPEVLAMDLEYRRVTLTSEGYIMLADQVLR